MLKHDLAQAFLNTASFQWDPDKGFRLASGAVSPFYVDCRLLLAHPRARHLVAQVAFNVISSLDIDCLGGMELGAVPLATAISAYALTASPSREWRTFVVRKEAKDHGLGKLIEGAATAGDHALVVDDVLTSGGSVIRAVHAARQASRLGCTSTRPSSSWIARSKTDALASRPKGSRCSISSRSRISSAS